MSKLLFFTCYKTACLMPYLLLYFNYRLCQ
nr:MAG TPA: hypothetical protein [Caudoviricetes sp.]